MFLTALAIIPSIVLLVYIYIKDRKEHEPLKLLSRCFFAGVILAIPASLLEGIEGGIIDILLIPGSLMYALLDAFIIAGLSEELFKYIFLKNRTWKSTHFDCTFDGIVYSVFVSLGFATYENIMYVLDGGVGTAIARMFTSIPGHTCFAIYMGYYYSKAKLASINGDTNGYKKYTKRALWVPVILHGLYDFPLFFAGGNTNDNIVTITVLLWFAYVIALFIVSFTFINKASNEDRYMCEELSEW